MRVLVLGGSVFVGRHVVEAALARGHAVTVFNRGTRATKYAGDVEHLRGDRDSDLSALQGRNFDAVLDCCGYTPQQLAQSGQALQDRAAYYLFISTISVYRRFAPGVVWNEDAPLIDSGEGYGGLKAKGEAALMDRFAGPSAILRPGLIIGPYDPTGRFTYWPLRLAQGGTVLAPGRPERPVQCIDARDLAAWCIALAERQTTGIFNAIGPQGSMAEMLAHGNAELRWMPDADLLAAEIAPWSAMPLWIPENDADFGGMLLGDNRRSQAAGLTTRPWADSFRDTLAWARQAGDSARGTAGISREQEQALLRSLDQA